MPPVPAPINVDDNIWFDADEGPDDVWTPPQPPHVQTVRVEDDTRLFEGVKPSISSFSSVPGSHYQPLFPRGALEQPRDPDMVQPTTPQPRKLPEVEDKEPRKKAIVPQNHPLHLYNQKKRSSGSDADDERLKK
ncbi:hypothetical protein EDB92DRAFT_1812857 [Lactarius akahatsu]|uniref:Uncharacterized protein n=1 Tax=Lactarius akahatsu TaxID=416441 RepID=A0AAD4LRJ9_9AGAM|nr:hypothetical protein EDB92DRAFT_1812857 [Lactarius akahatsu]